VAIRAIEADTEAFRGIIERAEREVETPLAIPADAPDVILRRIERILANALRRLEGWQADGIWHQSSAGADSVCAQQRGSAAVR